MKLALFVYNFPHKKTQDFLLKLFLGGFKIEFVIAADPIKLNLPPSNLRVKLRHINLNHPKNICTKLNIPYKVVDHNSLKVSDLLKKENIDIGIIAGARIFKENIIESVKKGIINFHPGLIPQIRGLDALKKAILYDVPLGVTAHLVDERIDAGRIIKKEIIPIYRDDNLIDLSLRLHETQVNMLPEVLKIVEDKEIEDFPLVEKENSRYAPPITIDQEAIVKRKFKDYIRKYAIS